MAALIHSSCKVNVMKTFIPLPNLKILTDSNFSALYQMAKVSVFSIHLCEGSD